MKALREVCKIGICEVFLGSPWIITVTLRELDTQKKKKKNQREREREREFTWVEGDAVGISLKRGEMIRS